MEKIYVAKLGKAVGLKGQLRLFIESDFPEQFKKGITFSTSKKNINLTIESINSEKDLIKFVGINSVEEAKKLTNLLLFTTLEASKENINLQDNQYFWFDLMECTIVENGKKLGVVSDIQRMPIDDYFLIETSNELVSSVEKGAKSFMLPYNDNFIINVDLVKKEIEVKGAIDIFEAS